uniref:Uncharacterized protein n=1 Tax=Rhizophora mucronata TaxID=61149 RepID=A0A2P2R4A1_RHIMU
MSCSREFVKFESSYLLIAITLGSVDTYP